jgi:GNAT superfamily N-acetyltransferase
MIFAAMNEAADRGELLLVEGGLCRWHRRRDGVVVIRELLVLAEERRQGIGRMLVTRVRQRNPGARVLAKCPREYPSNGFWARVGFVHVAESEGVNEWVLECA